MPVILGVVTACVIIAAAALVFMDNLMRAFMPSIYLTGRAANTYNELKDEYSEASSRTSFFTLLGSHHKITADAELDGIDFELTEQFDKSIPQSYITGKIKGISAEFIVNNDTTSVCLPDIADCRFSMPSDRLGAVLNASPVGALLPIKVSDSVSISIPEAAKKKDTAEIYNSAVSLLKSAKIEKRAQKEDKYTLLNVHVSGSDLSSALADIARFYLPEDNALAESFAEEISKLSFPADSVIRIGERDKKIVYLQLANAAPLSLTADFSGALKMLDNINISASYTIDDSALSLNIKSEGSHVRSNEAFSDDSSVAINTPLTGTIYAESYTHPKDDGSFSYRFKLQTGDYGSAVLNSTGRTDGESVSYDISELSLFDKHSASGTIKIEKQTEDIMIPERPEKELASVKSMFDLKK